MEKLQTSVVERALAAPLGGVRALWDGVIRYLPLLWSSLVWVTLSQLLGLSLCLSFSFLSLSLWLVFQMMMSLMERVAVEMRDCRLWWQLGWWLLAWLVCVYNWGGHCGIWVWLIVAGVGSLWINDQGGMAEGMLLVG